MVDLCHILKEKKKFQNFLWKEFNAIQTWKSFQFNQKAIKVSKVILIFSFGLNSNRPISNLPSITCNARCVCCAKVVVWIVAKFVASGFFHYLFWKMCITSMKLERCSFVHFLMFFSLFLFLSVDFPFNFLFTYYWIYFLIVSFI